MFARSLPFVALAFALVPARGAIAEPCSIAQMNALHTKCVGAMRARDYPNALAACAGESSAAGACITENGPRVSAKSGYLTLSRASGLMSTGIAQWRLANWKPALAHFAAARAGFKETIANPYADQAVRKEAQAGIGVLDEVEPAAKAEHL